MNADHHYIPEFHREAREGGQNGVGVGFGGKGGGDGTEGGPGEGGASGMSESDLAMFASVQMLRDRFDQEGGSESQMSQSASALNSGDEDVTQDLKNGGDLSDGSNGQQNGTDNDPNAPANAKNAANVGIDGDENAKNANLDGAIDANNAANAGIDGALNGAVDGTDTDGNKAGLQGDNDDQNNLNASNVEGGLMNENDQDKNQADLDAKKAGGDTEGGDNANENANANANADTEGGDSANANAKAGAEGGDDANANNADNAVNGANVDEEEGGESGPGKLGKSDLDIPMVVPGDEYEHKKRAQRDDEDVDLNYNEDYGKTVTNDATGLQGNPDADEYGVEVDNGRRLRGNPDANEYGVEVDNNKQLKGNKGNKEYGGEYESNPEKVVLNYNKEYGGEYESTPGAHVEGEYNEDYGGEWESKPVRDPNVLVSGQKVDDSYQIDYKNLKNMFERR
eukprot:TRINITY_DN3843_c0_g3_i3.p2 TRINITY_DN3843_c0_g3~~TRINITY_DN3843_c0_g3_i3.p2  ORF type:complete len:532 (+),score=139.84 TRINITY_DN3843_c0_g3_i3:237-1598(+)